MDEAVKAQFKAFYSTPWIREAIFKECVERNVCIRQDWGMVRHFSKHQLPVLAQYGMKPLLQDFIQFQTCGTNPVNPADIQYWINRNTLEFIPEVMTVYDVNRADSFIIDLDPKDPLIYDFEATRKATGVILEAIMGKSGDGAPLKDHDLPITGYKLRFSGNRSFHIYVGLSKRVDLTYIRDQLKVVLDGAIGPSMEDPIDGLRLSYHNVRDRKDFILVDIGAIARHRCVRSLWSMHAKTGLVCVPVHNLWSFDRNWAHPSRVTELGKVYAVGVHAEDYKLGLDKR